MFFAYRINFHFNCRIGCRITLLSRIGRCISCCIYCCVDYCVGRGISCWVGCHIGCCVGRGIGSCVHRGIGLITRSGKYRRGRCSNFCIWSGMKIFRVERLYLSFVIGSRIASAKYGPIGLPIEWGEDGMHFLFVLFREHWLSFAWIEKGIPLITWIREHICLITRTREHASLVARF